MGVLFKTISQQVSLILSIDRYLQCTGFERRIAYAAKEFFKAWISHPHDLHLLPRVLCSSTSVPYLKGAISSESMLVYINK